MDLLVTDLSRRALGDLIAAVGNSNDKRKLHQQRRINVFHDGLPEEVKKRIGERISPMHPHIIEDLCSYAEASFRNPMKEISRAVTRAAYLNPPIRRVAGFDDQENKNWDSFLKEIEANRRFPQVMGVAYVANSALVVPRIIEGRKGKRVKLETILPHMADVIVDPDDSDRAAIVGWKDAAGQIVLVDSEKFYTYAKDGSLTETEHLLGENPVTILRFGYPEADFWSTIKNRDLLEGSIEIGFQYAMMTRAKGFLNYKQAVFTGAELDKSAPQIFDLKEVPTLTPDEEGAPGDIKLLDMDLDPANYISTIDYLYASMAESRGLDIRTIDFKAGADVASLAPAYFRLAEVRKELTDPVQAFEKEVILKAVRMAEIADHPLKISYEKVRDGFSFDWDMISYPLTPLEQAEIDDVDIKRHVTTGAEILRRKRPGMTNAESIKQREANRAENVRDWQLSAEHNMPGSMDVETLPQAQGREGGIKGGEERRKRIENEQ